MDDKQVFLKAIDVSRETVARLESYELTLRKWQPAINLVSDSTLEQIWTRHFLDSAQLIAHLDESQSITDLGSGAGFPALVIAALTDRPVVLVESDARKCAFLSTAARAMGVKYRLLNKRVEQLPLNSLEQVTARAFAPLPRLLTWASPALTAETRLLLLKGRTWEEEVVAAQALFSFDLETEPSLTEAGSRILKITNISPKVAP